MSKKKPVTNGIVEVDGRFYMKCGAALFEIKIVENAKKGGDADNQG